MTAPNRFVERPPTIANHHLANLPYNLITNGIHVPGTTSQLELSGESPCGAKANEESTCHFHVQNGPVADHDARYMGPGSVK